MKAWILRGLFSFMPCVFPRSNAIEITEAPYKDRALNSLCMVLLTALRDNQKQIRLEQRPHSVRVFRFSQERQTEDMPLNRELGDALITAAKTFPCHPVSLDAEARTRRVPVLVAGHPVDLEFEWLPGSHGNGVVVHINDRGAETEEATAVRARDAEEFSIACVGDHDQPLMPQRNPGDAWLWYLECLGGRLESEEYRRELDDWARTIDALTKRPKKSDAGE